MTGILDLFENPGSALGGGGGVAKVVHLEHITACGPGARVKAPGGVQGRSPGGRSSLEALAKCSKSFIFSKIFFS